MTPLSTFTSERMVLYQAIFFSRPLYSVSISSRCRPVRRCRRMSRMALAWMSSSPKRSSRRVLASSGLAEERMMRTTSSILSMAMRRPSRICALASDFARSKRVLLMTTSRL